MNRYEAVRKIRHWHEGKCPQCKRPTLYSYVLPSDQARLIKVNGRAKELENCGFYCAGCGWGNAGSRENWDAESTASETNKIVSVRYRP